MLENLDKVDWDNIWGCYGKADKFPEWIRALASTDRKLLREAWYKIQENSNHQSQIYPVTSYLFQFLIELVQYEEIPNRTRILNLLGRACFNGDPKFSYSDPPDFVESDVMKSWREGWEKINGEKHSFFVERARKVAAEGVEVYLKLLYHPKPKIQLAAIKLLSGFPELAAKTAPALTRVILNTPYSKIRAAAIWALRNIVKPDPVYFDLLWPYFQTDQKDRVRYATALAMAKLTPEQTTKEVIDYLLELTIRFRDKSKSNQRILNGEFNYSESATLMAFCYLGPKWNDLTIPILLKGMERSEFYRENYLETLLHLLFIPDKSRKKVADLNEMQKLVYDKIGYDKYFWTYSHERKTRQMIYHFGLPY